MRNIKTTSPADRHSDHIVYVDQNPRDRHGHPVKIHHAALRCRTCNVWLKWLTADELAGLQDLIKEGEL